MTNIQIFQNDHFGPLRVFGTKDEPWFVGKEVCDSLGIRTDTIPVILDADEYKKVDPKKIGLRVNAPHGVTMVNEPGLYTLVVRSRKPEAKQFKRWVTHEVLPYIRKTGNYLKSDSVTRKELAMMVIAAEEENERLQKQIEESKPKLDCFDDFMESRDLKTVRESAKILGTGERRLFSFMRDKGILDRNNVPYQRYIDRGYFKVKVKTYDTGYGVKTHSQTFFTSRGISWMSWYRIRKKENS